jgi:hypothetical protein
MMFSDEVGAAEESTLLQVLAPLVSVRVEDEIVECHRRVHDQGGATRSGFVFSMPVAHLIGKAGQRADNAAESSKSFFRLLLMAGSSGDRFRCF